MSREHPLLRRLSEAELPASHRDPVDAKTLEAARAIVDDVRLRGETALREHAVRLGDLAEGEPLVRERAELDAALAALPAEQRALLERTATRVRSFADAQRKALMELTVDVPGGRAGHFIQAVARAGCYAPGGRFPLPSSVLMTVCAARAAGVPSVWLASPRPAPITLAAAAVAGADALLAVGGAQAIAALTFGAGPVPACDILAGPGNRWVTAAKQLVSGRVGIDMLAGPSELLVLADGTADPATIAADLLAQAEHDPDAVPCLLTTDESLLAAVDVELVRQLETLPTRATAEAALKNGFAVVASSMDAAVAIADRLAPEHLELMCRDASSLAQRVKNYGAVFVGSVSAEVFGDYGVGPNHVLPTGGTARFTGGLSVLTFLRVRTWLELDDPALPDLAKDAAALARLEGLEAHARAAEKRLQR
jgi:phosphoribosyl-ATP pyrophosphohydrolase/phosphoribosyl-AMP cyclohydrolase/histidinol dehydrogenase